MVTRELTDSPSVLPMYAKAIGPVLPVVGSMPGVRRSGGELPDLELSRRAVSIDPAHIAAYSEVCGFGVPRNLPATYPHVLAFPLHMALMTDGAFPFAPMGMVHLENRIVQHRTLSVDDVLDLRVRPENLRPHAKGQQFDITSTVSVDGEVVWEDVSTFLRRGRPSAGEVQPSRLADVDAPAGATRWSLGGDLGRRYAAVSGDRNPIHLYGLTAKAFGFPRQIAHGMWSKGRCLAALQPRLPEEFEITVAFKKPVLLPSTVSFGAEQDGGRWTFGLRNAKRDSPHLVGAVTPL